MSGSFRVSLRTFKLRGSWLGAVRLIELDSTFEKFVLILAD